MRSNILDSVKFVQSRYSEELHPTILQSNMLTAIAERRTSYPVFRKLTFAVYIELEKFFDDVALNLGWKVHRINEGTILMDSDGLYIHAEGKQKSDYCSCTFDIWADSIESAEAAQSEILTRYGSIMLKKTMVSICWVYMNSKRDLQKAHIEELVDEDLCDEAYPELEGGITKFIEDYLNSSEAILVIQGKPGTGKTRLIRAILGAMTKRKGEKVGALYSGDAKLMESDEVFLSFVTGPHEAFVIEDADHLLRPRQDGNENLHRFLTIADGVVRAQGRKIIFSTNLPNVGDIDEALVRPGRCFARLMVREHSQAEAIKLLERLCDGNSKAADQIMGRIMDSSRKGYTVAELYRAVTEEQI